MGKSQSLVSELQHLATDQRNDIADLLRKALLVATKLKIDDFREWISCELHGYGGNKQVPAYRTARAELRARNPYHGLIPFYLQDPRAADAILNVELREAIGSYVHLLATSTSGQLILQLSPAQVNFLLQGQDVFLEPVRLLARNTLAAVIDTVRTTVLEWALRLEGEGISGEGMTFSDEEKQKAAASTEIHIGNFQGVFGDVADSFLSQNLQMEVKQGDFESLRRYLKTQGIEDADIHDLERALAVDPQPAKRGQFGPRVSEWIGTMVSKAATGGIQLAIGVVGSLLAQAIWAYYGH